MIITSAPGKIILFGEHAVVYNKVGIACAIEKRCKVYISSLDEDQVVINAKSINQSGCLKKEELFNLWEKIEKAKRLSQIDKIREVYEQNILSPSFFVIACLFKEYGFSGLEIKIESNLPKNLGSSSAVFSSIALGVSSFLGEELSREQISNIAYQGDLIAHGGTPSGIDNSVVTYGGYLKYKKTEGIKFLNIDFKVPLLIVMSGELSNTGEMVSFVRKKKEQNQLFVKAILEDLNSVSEKALVALEQKNLNLLGKLMTDYYQSLKKLDISTQKLDKIINIAISNGALGAKPTGAWGGGCCLVLGRDQEQILSLAEIFKKNNFECFQATIGAEGVKKES